MLKLRDKTVAVPFPITAMRRDDAGQMIHRLSRTYFVQKDGLRPIIDMTRPMPQNYLDVEVRASFSVTANVRSEMLDELHMTVEDFFSILEHAGIQPTFGVWGGSMPPTIWFKLSSDIDTRAVYEVDTLWGGGEKEVQIKVKCKKLEQDIVKKALAIDRLLYALIMHGSGEIGCSRRVS